MKTSFVLPSCDYNIGITKDELQQLLDTGYLTVTVSKTPCKSTRIVYNGTDFEAHDDKDVHNNLCFHLDENVADMEDGYYCVQFLRIHINKED